MPLPKRKHFKKPGLPEAVALLMALLVAFPLMKWWGSYFAVPWQRAPGRILRCEFKDTRFSATQDITKVLIQYEYAVAGVSRVGSWMGTWPQTGSPNALPKDSLDRLQDPGFPLVVLYNPVNPSQSRLDYADTGTPAIYASLALLAALAAGVYYVRVYPAWRSS
ncbi:MAG TPA: DUF3592 domain-containing protein [Candidatus Hydrogenedentes bacterium]|nr:DUF3592 domain-containing protein [Candidatus Hydrogenedentota bacterium]HOS01503.1 DUF3592 domain-containing protein [Candidatus Hydrogenedentota bacterium]